jgi:glycosyltransferase involved in cell wall biosynthesis
MPSFRIRKDDALIDVLIPIYNAERTVESAVRSILDQTTKNIRVILIDDGSTDGTSKICTKLAAEDPRLEVIRTHNNGIVSALNLGLSRCTAPLIARHDADDLALPDRFEKQMRYLNDHPDCVAVGGNVRHIDENGCVTSFTKWRGDAGGNPSAIPAHEPYLMHPFLMVRRSQLLAVGGYRHVLHSEDTDLYWRLLPHGRLHCLADILGDYRIHSNSITSGSLNNVRAGAVSSQLGAISARRRMQGSKDLVFSDRRAKKMQAMDSLAKMVAFSSEGLAPDERSFLEVSTAAKMMELRVYRKFKFQTSDKYFILQMLLRHWRMLSFLDARILAMRPVHYLKPRVHLRRFLAMFGIHSLV